MLLTLVPAIRAQQAASGGDNDDADSKEVFNYVLSMDKIRKLAAVQTDVKALQKANPDLQKQMDNDNTDGNLSALAQKVQKYPRVAAIVKKDGLTPREYIVGTLALIQAGLGVSMKKNGTFQEYPLKMLTLVNPANLKIVEANWDEIVKLMPSIEVKESDFN